MPNQQNQKTHVRGPGSIRDEVGMQLVVLCWDHNLQQRTHITYIPWILKDVSSEQFLRTFS